MEAFRLCLALGLRKLPKQRQGPGTITTILMIIKIVGIVGVTTITTVGRSVNARRIICAQRYMKITPKKCNISAPKRFAGHPDSQDFEKCGFAEQDMELAPVFSRKEPALVFASVQNSAHPWTSGA